MRRIVFLILALVALSGCDLITGYEPNVSFQAALLTDTADQVNSVDITGAPGAVFAVGTIVTPDSCQTVSGNYRVQGNVLTLTVTSRGRTQCGTSGGAYRYTMAVEGLDRGTYTVKVVYDWAGQQPSQTILEEELIIS